VNQLRLALSDRRRRQRGSVLSGVLIIVAFLSIIAGALMTELSTNFLISHALVTRIGSEATVNSAMELAVDSLQHTSLGSPCPAPVTVSLNGRTATVAYANCAPSTRVGIGPQLIASNGPFTIDSTHVVLPNLMNELLIGDVNSNLYAYGFGQSSPSWTFPLEGILTGPPTAVADFSDSPPGIFDLVPVSDPDDGGSSPNCGTHGFCVAVLAQSSTSASPDLSCFMAANAKITGRPAAGAGYPGLAYFGDAGGTLFVYAAGSCAQVTSASVGQPIVSGPIVFKSNPSKHVTNDEIYAVASDGNSSRLLHFTYSPGGDEQALNLDSSLPLPAANAIGMAIEPGTLPSRLAITFAGGQVGLVQIQSDFNMSMVASANLQTAIGGSPYWCQCPGGDLVGVGGRNGLYLLDMGLNVSAAYPAGSTVIATAPAADSAGDWFFGADDGSIYEVQRPATGPAMTLAEHFANLGARVGSSASVGPCPAGICVYVGLRNGNAYLLQLDSRDALMTACLVNAANSCSGANPRLWAHAYVGLAGSPQTVRIVGWSYYSP
jgi:hypothetical protein